MLPYAALKIIYVHTFVVLLFCGWFSWFWLNHEVTMMVSFDVTSTPRHYRQQCVFNVVQQFGERRFLFQHNSCNRCHNCLHHLFTFSKMTDKIENLQIIVYYLIY